ncbi:MAG: nitrite/sulfite reductase [Myxococcota bacterium]
MYQYDAIDQEIVDARVEEYRDQVARRLSGALTEEEFRPLRLMNGLYLQLHGYMLRVAIPYGTLSSRQLRALAEISRRYDKGYGHFTTRQNIQFNWPKLVETPDLLADLAKVEMHAIQTSGNCIRNVTTDPFAGAAADEVEDPRITCEIIRQWSTLHPEFAFLPRKFKIAVTASPHDRAAIAVHDIGVRVVDDPEEGPGFEIWAGGGQGRAAYLAALVRRFLPRARLLSYLEAIMRVYNRYGRRDNKYKARIKILVNSMGAEAFTEEVEREWQQILAEEAPVDVPQGEWDRVGAFFDLELPPAQEAEADDTHPGFARWRDVNVVPHRRAVYANVVISLKPRGGIPGDASASQMEGVAELADRFGQSEIRVTHQQNLVLPHVRRRDLSALHRALVELDLATANLDQASDIIACPGMDYCTLANARSIPIAQSISARFDESREAEIGKLNIKISGCINACGHHHVGHIGILGIDKRGEESYQLAIGGSHDENAALAKVLGRAISAEEVPAAIDAIIEVWMGHRLEGETLPRTVQRVGLVPFKEKVYGFVHA